MIKDGVGHYAIITFAEIIAIIKENVIMEPANVIKASQENYAQSKSAQISAMKMELVSMAYVLVTQDSQD